MIVATAGHVDHGKTSLVRALTGIDTDRLAEEKRRGLSIDLGFAHADLGGDEPVGFVDVPGHERFVRNMLAGIAAIDVALVVVAADDGPMPQTVEHVAVLDLLGVPCAVVALSKADRVTAERLARVAADIEALLAPTSLRGAPVLPVSAVTGAGLPALRAHLASLQRALPPRAVHGHFRLAVDRSFTRAGEGLVVTGAVLSGAVAVGDALVVSPHGVPVRVRGLQRHGTPVERVCAGQRCALSLAGGELKRADPERGDWLVAPQAHAPTARLDAEVRLLAEAPRALGEATALQLHVGTATRPVRVTPLAQRRLEPGAAGRAQLVLEAPVAALRGDRFVLRDPAAQRIVGGGRVLDPFAPARGRMRPERLADLDAMAEPTADAALARLLEAHPSGIDAARFVQAWNLDAADAAALQASRPIVAIDARWIAAAHWAALAARIDAALSEWHAAHPDSVGVDAAALARAAGRDIEPAVWRAALRERVESGGVVRDGLVLRLASHRARLSAEDAALLGRTRAVLHAHGLRPPPLGELAAALQATPEALQPFLARAAALGHLVQVAKNRWFLPETIAALVHVARDTAAASPEGRFDAASFRDRSGIGRNLTIQLLEFLDRQGITRVHALRRWVVEDA